MASRKAEERRGSASDKKPQKARTDQPTQYKSSECETCQSAVEAEDKGIECEVCKGWYHAACVDITDNEYEVLATHKLGTIHWYCATCNVKSVQLLRLGFQPPRQTAKSRV